MAGVPARFQTFFRISPAEPGEAQCFAVRRGDVQVRVDAKYYALRETLQSSFPLVNLGDLVVGKPNYGTSARATVRTSESQPRYIRITDYGDDGIEPGHEFVTAELVEDGYELRVGDVLFARSGSVGKTYIHEDDSEPAIFAGYCIRFRFSRAKVSPRFVYWWTKTAVYDKWVAAIQRPSVQSNINMAEFQRCQIPLPPIEFQNELVAAMDAARAERKAKLAEADALLAGMDDYVLDALSINSNPQQQNTFAVRINRTESFRADPDFHSLRFRTIRSEIENGRYSAKRMDEICNLITSGFAAGRRDQAFDYETGVPHLRPLNLDTFGQLSLANTKFVPRESVSDANWCVRGEVLFNNTNSTDMVGKSAVFDVDQPCACSNHMTRLRLRPGIDPEYIASVLNALRRLGYLGLLSTNFNNQAGINTDTLKQLQIPQPPLAEQERIAVEIGSRREEARRLRAEAEAGWQAARRWFEGELLGGGAG